MMEWWQNQQSINELPKELELITNLRNMNMIYLELNLTQLTIIDQVAREDDKWKCIMIHKDRENVLALQFY